MPLVKAVGLQVMQLMPTRKLEYSPWPRATRERERMKEREYKMVNGRSFDMTIEGLYTLSLTRKGKRQRITPLFNS